MEKQTKPELLGMSMAKLVLAVAIIVSLGVVLGVIKIVKDLPVKNISPQVTPAPKPATSAIDETKDWKTYRNEEYGFEFKYPLDFEEQKPESDSILLEATKTDRGSSYYLSVYVRPNYKVNQIVSTVAEAEEIVVGDHSGYKYFYIEGAGMSEVALIQAEQDALSISFDSIGNGQNFATADDRKIYVQDFLNQILSTFKFIGIDESENIAMKYCSGNNTYGSYSNIDKVFFLNFDNDKANEVAGVCWDGYEDGDKEGFLFVLDFENGKYVPILEEEGQIQHQRFYDFQNLQFVDVDKDGVNEIMYEGMGWYMAGGDHWLKLYSPKYKEWFSKTNNWSLDESDPTGEKRIEKTTFSQNLENNKYQIFKNFLIKQNFSL